jgi:hypothetical protein
MYRISFAGCASQHNPTGTVGCRKTKTHNLKLDSLALKLYCTNLEVYTDSTNITLRVGVVGKTKEKAGLVMQIRG